MSALMPVPGAVPRTSTFALVNQTLPYALKLAAKGLEIRARLAERRAQRASDDGRPDLIPQLPTPEATESDWGAFDDATRGGL